MFYTESLGEQKVKIIQVKKCDEICNLLKKFDNLFRPQLSVVIKDFAVYSRKLEELANVYAAKIGEEVLGFIVFYANDHINKIAYGLFLAVFPHLQNKGIGHLLMNTAFRKSMEQGMTKFKIDVNKKNVNAINIYKKCGFKYLSEKNDEFDYMIKEL